MADEKRISVSFGAFAVDIEGYDDPFAVLSAVISHVKAASDAPLGEKSFAAADLENAALLATLSSEAAQLEIRDDGGKQRLLVKPDTVEPVVETETPAEPEIEAATETPSEPEPLSQEPVSEANEEPVAAATGTVAETIDETTPPVEASSPEIIKPETIKNEPTTADAEDTSGGDEAAILRRVRRTITQVDDIAAETTPEAPKPKPKPTAKRSPAEQKADVVRDIATTLRRIGASTEEVAPENNDAAKSADAPAAPKPEPIVDAAAEPEASDQPVAPKITPLVAEMPVQKGKPSKIRDGATGQLKPKARKPLTMQMQIRPKTPTGGAKTTPPKPAETPVAAKTAVPNDHAAETRQALDRDKIRERLVDLAKEDEVIDNFLFDDVEAVEVGAAAANGAATPPAGTETSSKENTPDAEEPLILTAAEAAPLILDNPIAEPLVLTDPIEPPEAVAAALVDDASVREAPAPPMVEPEKVAVAEPEAEPEADEVPAPSGKKKGKSGVDDVAGFERLAEVRNTPIPMMLEPGTRPKRRNGGPRLVALSDETQFDDSMSPQDFAAHIGATSLHDLLEATAVYMAIVEGRANFSRQDVMQAFARIETAGSYTTEQRLKTFRKLLASGALTRVDERDFALSHDTRFGYETQLRA